MWLSALSSEQRQALLGLAHNVVVSDGLLDPNEEGMLDEFRREMELHPTAEAEYLDREDEIFIRIGAFDREFGRVDTTLLP